MQFTITAPAQLGMTLRGLRKARKLTQVQISLSTGLNQKTVSGLETDPQRGTIDSLFRYLAAVNANVVLDQSDDTPQAAKRHAW